MATTSPPRAKRACTGDQESGYRTGPRTSVHRQLMKSIREHIAARAELSAVQSRTAVLQKRPCYEAEICVLRAAAAQLQTVLEQSAMASLQARQQTRWPHELPTSVLLLIVEQCTFPGVPHLMMTSTAPRELIEPQLHKTIPHLCVPRDVVSVQAAIDLAPAGGLIAVSEGLYDERLSVNRCVHLRSVGRVEETVITQGCTATGSTQASLTGVTLICDWQESDESESEELEGGAAILLVNSDARLVRCVVTGGGIGVLITGANSIPALTRCRIRGNACDGVVVDEKGAGTFTECDIYHNQGRGVWVTDEGSNPQLERCQIRENKGDGVCIDDKGGGKFTECDIYNNKDGLMVTDEGSNPQLERCQIRDNQGDGVFIHAKGIGTFSGCDIHSNQDNGVFVKDEGSNPQLERCQIRDNKVDGVYADDKCGGKFTECDIYNNEEGLMVTSEGNPQLERCRIRENKGDGVFVHAKGIGTFTECDIHSNQDNGVFVTDEGSNPQLERCQIRDNACGGVHVVDKGGGTFRECGIRGNQNHAVYMEDGGSNLQLERCQIIENAYEQWWACS